MCNVSLCIMRYLQYLMAENGWLVVLSAEEIMKAIFEQLVLLQGVYPKMVVTPFSLLFATTFSEIMRSAYLAIEKGQYEAAVSIGLSPFQAFHRIVLPQAVVVALPNLGNSCIKLMQEGAFAFTVGLVDVMWQNTLIIFRNYGAYAMETYLALALLYWLLTIGLEKSFLFLEARLSRGRKAWA